MSVTVTNPFVALEPIGLDELNAHAALQTRVDRKYIVGGDRAADVIHGLAAEVRCRTLTIDGRRRFAYRSTYFDTPGFDAYLDAARSRPTRYKVRVRTYLDAIDRDSFVEVKTRRQGGSTVKVRTAVPITEHDALSDDSIGFVETAIENGLTGRVAAIAVGQVAAVRPVLVTDYSRVTLYVDDGHDGDVGAASRATIDTGLRFTLPGEQAHRCHSSSPEPATHPVVIIETKNAGGPGPVDRYLWKRGVRPTSISKFGIGLALIRPDLPHSKWHRTIRRHFEFDHHAMAA